ncbi:hypothetical protein TWF696_001624 [Orbilia brochopaga]|uniref:Uncharacterized protein n=1 Tax=Orbilia brochopaga TaxID=3140254 RepID=A0AAV9U9H0_9PEZI
MTVAAEFQEIVYPTALELVRVRGYGGRRVVSGGGRRKEGRGKKAGRLAAVVDEMQGEVAGARGSRDRTGAPATRRVSLRRRVLWRGRRTTQRRRECNSPR